MKALDGSEGGENARSTPEKQTGLGRDINGKTGVIAIVYFRKGNFLKW